MNFSVFFIIFGCVVLISGIILDNYVNNKNE